MSDSEFNPEKTYLTKLKIEMSNYYGEWEKEEFDNKHLHWVKLDSKFKELVKLKWKEISIDFKSLNEMEDRLNLVLNLRKEIAFYTSNYIKPYDEYRDNESKWISAYIEHVENIFLKPEFLQIQIKYKSEPSLNEVEIKKDLPNEKFINANWFKVGLLFATGEMDSLITKFSTGNIPSCPKIAQHLGNAGYNKFILATHYNYQNSNKDKNIYFIKNGKALKIYNHCKAENIEMTEKFKALFLTDSM